MVFSSSTFLFIFLPLVLLMYFSVNMHLRNYVLLIASIAFYTWGEPKYVLIMLMSIVVNYSSAVMIDKLRSTLLKKMVVGFAVISNISVLIYFKYLNFSIENINNIFNGNIKYIEIIMPIGISFFTFQALSYVIDVYRRETKVQYDISKLALYISFFPQLIAGPIVKYHDICNQIEERIITSEKVVSGFKRFIIGLSKKVLLANSLGLVADEIFNYPIEYHSFVIAWFGAICYTLQLFFDFSGYSDMAIGLGRIFGFEFLENFNYPYISKTITEFWRRWHISLGSWFREYLYFPLGGNRKSPIRVSINLMIVFLATGLWHGANWTFVIWGLWHGIFMTLERGLIRKWHIEVESIYWNIYTMIVVIIGWVVFRSPDLTYAIKYISIMINPLLDTTPVFGLGYYINNKILVALMVGIIISAPNFTDWIKLKSSKNQLINGCINFMLISLMILDIAFIAASTYNPFIYFRF